jgi:hypothetical protein
VATSAAGDKSELEALLTTAFDQVLAPAAVAKLDIHRRFQLGAAETAMREEFDEILVRRLDSAIVLPAVQPLLRYVDSLRWLYEPALPSGCTWEAVMTRLRAITSEALTARGALRVTTHTGFVVGRCHRIRPGGVSRSKGRRPSALTTARSRSASLITVPQSPGEAGGWMTRCGRSGEDRTLWTQRFDAR